MASGTINLTNSSQTPAGGYLMGKVEWTSSADTASNSSSVTAKLYVKKAITSGTISTPTTGTWTCNLTINGSAATENVYTSIGADWVLMMTRTVTVPHNNDGSKSATISAYCWAPSGTSYQGKGPEGSGTAVLDTIPRASKIGATDANIESTSTITISRASSNFSHTITYNFSGLTGTIASKTTATSIAWSVPAAFYAKIPNAKSGVCTLTCTTYSGNTVIGTSTCTLTVTAASSVCAPTVSGTVIDTNSSTVSLTGNSAALIRYKSTARCTISATAKNSASISSKLVNNTATSNNIKDFPGVSTNSFVFKATDSRGYAASITKNPTMIQYVQLTCNPILSRPTPTGSTIVMTFSGNYFNGSFGAYANTLTIRYRYKESEAESYGAWATIDQGNYTINGATYRTNSAITVGENFNYQTAYTFQVQAYDGANGIALSTITQTISVAKGIPVYSWGENDFTVHKKMIVAGELNASSLTVAGTLTASGLTAESRRGWLGQLLSPAGNGTISNFNSGRGLEPGIWIVWNASGTAANGPYSKAVGGLCLVLVVYKSDGTPQMTDQLYFDGSGEVYYRQIYETTPKAWRQLSGAVTA